jgi:hypothetical protein
MSYLYSYFHSYRMNLHISDIINVLHAYCSSRSATNHSATRSRKSMSLEHSAAPTPRMKYKIDMATQDSRHLSQDNHQTQTHASRPPIPATTPRHHEEQFYSRVKNPEIPLALSAPALLSLYRNSFKLLIDCTIAYSTAFWEHERQNKWTDVDG